MMSTGLIGLFVGAVILALAYVVFMRCVAVDEDASVGVADFETS